MKFVTLLFLTFNFFQLAQASAPFVKKAPPGYYRFMVGDIEVTPLLDGSFQMPVAKMLKDIKSPEIAKLLSQSYEGPEVTTSIIGFLVNTGTKLVLIDTGVGGGMGNLGGHLLENLQASGYSADQVDEIYLTHMHGDHIGGITTDGKANYPQAIVRADHRDADYWLSDAEAAKATNPMLKPNFDGAKKALAPYQASDKFKPFDGETELTPGIHAHPAYGHTPGHTVYTVESKGKKLWLFGDMIHVAAVQFPKPTATIAFDYDSKKAVAVRANDFATAAKAGDLIAAAHLPFPGVGHIKAAGSGYNYLPLTYAPLAP